MLKTCDIRREKNEFPEENGCISRNMHDIELKPVALGRTDNFECAKRVVGGLHYFSKTGDNLSKPDGLLSLSQTINASVGVLTKLKFKRGEGGFT